MKFKDQENSAAVQLEVLDDVIPEVAEDYIFRIVSATGWRCHIRLPASATGVATFDSKAKKAADSGSHLKLLLILLKESLQSDKVSVLVK